MAAHTKQAVDEPTFETAMDRLEAIVDEMEDGKIPLETLLVRYEEGMKLVKVCQERLAKAEQKIEMITRDSGGKKSVKPFDEPTPAAASEQPVEKESKDDVRLF